MPIINVPGPGEKLRQNYLLNAPPGITLAPELVPVVLVDDFSGGLELGDAAMAVVQRTGLAGSRSQILFAANRNVSRRYRLTDFWVNCGAAVAAVTFSLVGNTTGFTQTFTKGWRDARKEGIPALNTLFGDSLTTTIGIQRILGTFRLNAQNVSHHFPIPIELVQRQDSPVGAAVFGRELMIECGNVNQILEVTCAWEELQQSG